MDPIVITGMGVVCSVGANQQEFLGSIWKATSGINPMTRVDPVWLPSRLAGEITAVDPQELVSQQAGDVTRCDALAILATNEALAQADVELTAYSPRRVGLSLGTCQGNIDTLEQGLQAGDEAAEFPFTSDVVASTFGIAGPRVLVSNACAAGAAAIGLAAEKLRQHEIDIAIAGGADQLAFFSLAGFGVLNSLDPLPCSPYGRSSGLTVGEGAGIVILERAEDARRRGTEPLAAVLGYGLSADAYQPTAPDPTGRGAALAMTRALIYAGLTPDDVDYVNGHGTATPANDQMERNALKAVFGPRSGQVPMSSTKSMIGHLLGAAGAVEAVACVMAIRNNVLPPTINVPDDAPATMDCVANAARPAQVATTMSNNYAFGGSNASLVLGSVRERPSAETRTTGAAQRVVISGIGCVGGLGIGLEAWRAGIVEGRCTIETIDPDRFGGDVLGAPCPPLNPRGVAPPAMWRKMDELARMCVVGARSAWTDAGLEAVPRAKRENIGVLLATALGSLDLSLGFVADARRGKGQANAKDFPHTAMNAAAGHVCTMLDVRGPNLSLSGGGLSSIAAISYAADLIRTGVAECILVTAADELAPVVPLLGRKLGVPLSRTVPRPFDRDSDGVCFGAASVTLVLESLDSALARGANIHAEIAGVSLVGTGPGETFLTRDTWSDAVEAVLDRSKVPADRVGYCAASASGFPDLDQGELAALTGLFGSGIRVGAPKSMVGDCLASAGPINVMAAVLAVQSGLMTPTLNLREPLDGSGVTHERAAVSGVEVDYALANAGVRASGAGCVLVAGPDVHGATP